MKKLSKITISVLSLVILSSGCGGGGSNSTDSAGQDSADTSTPDQTADNTDDGPASDTGGDVNPDLSVDSTQDADTATPSTTYAFVTSKSEELLPGRDAVGRPGDFRIGNNFITAIIGSADHAIWGPFGGGILDITVPGHDDFFEEQFPIAGLMRGVRVETVKVVEDGTKGKALIRVTGRDGPVPLVAAVLPFPPADVDVVVEYSLNEDSKCLEMATTVTNNTNTKKEVPIGDAVVFSEAGRTFGAGGGFDTGALIGQQFIDYLGTDLPSVSYIMAPITPETMRMDLTQEELNVIAYKQLVLQPGKSGTFRRCLYAAPGRSINAVASYWSDRSIDTEEVTGQVVINTQDYDFSSISIDIYSGELFVGSANTGPDGNFEFLLPPGQYQATVKGAGVQPQQVQWTVEQGQSLNDLVIDPPDPGRVDVEVVDDQGNQVPARVIAQPGLDAAFWADRVALVPSIDGKVRLFVPAGPYTIQGSFGPQWSYCRKSVELEAGQTQTLNCPITRQLDIGNWVSGDMHTHTEFSIDSQMIRHVRVTADLAEGLNFWASTEHDVFTDFTAVVEELGLTGVIVPSLGNEVSPVGRHFNGLGCKPATEEMYKYFVVPWTGYTEDGEVAGFLPCPAVWKIMHEDFGCRIVQINHPRDGQGYFDFVKYDPVIGLSSAKAGELDTTFDAIEVWNSTDSWDHMANLTLVDWYSFLNRGINKVATGNADTHDLDQWAGQPRNVVLVDGELTEDSFYDALMAFRSQVTGAPFIEFTANGLGLGSTVIPDTETTPVTLDIVVRAPTWAPLTTVQLVANGQVVQEWDISPETELVRLEASVDVTPEIDTWYHVRTFHPTADLAPVYPGRTSAGFTNPIWVDLKGDGFEAPIQ